MKKINFLIFAVALSVQSSAQQYLYSGTTEISNLFPFASNTSNFRQSVYHPADFPTAPAGNITAIYLKASAAVTPNITNLTVKMGNTAMIIYPDGTFLTGLQTVYSGSYNQSSITGNYIKIPLLTPFPYDPAKNFVVELSQSGYTTGFSLMQGSVGVTSRSIYGNVNNTSGTLTHRLPTMGFDMSGSMATTEVGAQNGIYIYPNPVEDVLNLTKVSEGAIYTLYDAAGRQVAQGAVTKRRSVDVSALRPGVYFISVTDKDEVVLNTKFIKK